MTDFLKGAAFALAIFGLMGLTQISTNFDDPNAVASDILNLYQGVQPRIWRLLNSTPTLNSMNSQEVILFQSTQSLVVPRIYTKINNTLWSVNLSSQ